MTNIFDEKMYYLRQMFEDGDTPAAGGDNAGDGDGEDDEETAINVSDDFVPAISIDFVNRLVKNIKQLQKALGITAMIPMGAGTQVKRYKTVVDKKSGAVAEGEIIPLSKVKRIALDPIEVILNKWRKQTTIEAIQKVGTDRALNDADSALVKEIQGDVRNDFFELITANTATSGTAGATLQAACANAWGALSVYFEDNDVTPVFFLNPLDVATHLGTATLTTQTAFGLTYLENFLGLGNAFLSSKVTKGHVFATVVENLNGVYVPASGDVADTFSLTYDEVGLIGMTHAMKSDNASIDSLIVSGVKFFPEDASGIIDCAISA